MNPNNPTRFRRRLPITLCIALAVAALNCRSANEINPNAATPAADPNDLYEQYWQFHLRRNPERASYLGDHRYDDRLYDYSEQARADELRHYDSWIQRIAHLRAGPHALPDPLSAELFERRLQDHLDLARFPERLMPIKQQDSPQIALGMIQTYHPFATPTDCKNYASRLHGFSKQVDDLIRLMDRGIREQVVRPRITIEQSLPQIEAMITDHPTDCTLYAPAKTLSTAAGGESSAKLIEAATADAIKSLARLRDYLRNDYLPSCRDTLGYCFLPNGKAWYRRLAKHHTTTDLSPERIHQIGLDELNRIHADMRIIMREVAFNGDLQAFIENLRNDPAQHNKTAEEILRRHRENLARSDANLPRLFGTLPKIPYDLHEMEPFRAPGAPAAYYYNAPDDGSRPAYFYVNTYAPETRPIYTMEALAYHEAMPGHHLQLAIAQQTKNLPRFRRFGGISAYTEGWALYAELLGYQLGGYRDPYARFGQLTYDAWRSARLVVDTGIHYFGWSREKAINFMADNTGLSRQNIVSEVDRYIAWPGQALAYKIGQLEILKLREEAQTALATAFDLRAFHDHLLAEGALPLSTLRNRMTAWTDRQH